jgi:hypothetical protein
MNADGSCTCGLCVPQMVNAVDAEVEMPEVVAVVAALRRDIFAELERSRGTLLRVERPAVPVLN